MNAVAAPWDPRSLPLLSRGSHADPMEGMNFLEAIAWLDNEPHTDCPASVCPSIAAACRVLDFEGDDEERRALTRHLSRVRGTANVGGGEYAHIVAMVRWAVNEALPAVLARHGFEAEAEDLRGRVVSRYAESIETAREAVPDRLAGPLSRLDLDSEPALLAAVRALRSLEAGGIGRCTAPRTQRAAASAVGAVALHASRATRGTDHEVPLLGWLDATLGTEVPPPPSRRGVADGCAPTRAST